MIPKKGRQNFCGVKSLTLAYAQRLLLNSITHSKYILSKAHPKRLGAKQFIVIMRTLLVHNLPPSPPHSPPPSLSN